MFSYPTDKNLYELATFITAKNLLKFLQFVYGGWDRESAFCLSTDAGQLQ